MQLRFLRLKEQTRKTIFVDETDYVYFMKEIKCLISNETKVFGRKFCQIIYYTLKTKMFNG